MTQYSGSNYVANLMDGGTVELLPDASLEVGNNNFTSTEYQFDGQNQLIFDTNKGLNYINVDLGRPVILGFYGIHDGNSIDVRGIPYSASNWTLSSEFYGGTSAVYVLVGKSALLGAQAVLNLYSAAPPISVPQPTDFADFDLALAADGFGGTLITIACFCRGTRIDTPFGQRHVEELSIDDLVKTADGLIKPIRWIGRRSYAGRFLAAHPNVHPVCFRASSLGPGLPQRDLRVSPEHALFLNGLLIPARCLVNGETIVIETTRRSVEYFHIELDHHDIVLAEGVQTETFVADDSRAMFDNSNEFAQLYPGRTQVAEYCAPRVDSGYELQGVRQRLAAIARSMEAAMPLASQHLPAMQTGLQTTSFT